LTTIVNAQKLEADKERLASAKNLATLRTDFTNHVANYNYFEKKYNQHTHFFNFSFVFSGEIAQPANGQKFLVPVADYSPALNSKETYKKTTPPK
jgi:hypothetical protein